MTANIKPVNLRLVDPPFGLRLVTLILELDYLRKKPLGGTTRPLIFFQLKNIFHLLGSIGSARIEGNQTTLAEYIERKIEGSKTRDEKFFFFFFNEEALNFIEENINDWKIDHIFLSQIHKIITQGKRIYN